MATPITLTYSQVNGLDIKLDVYVPSGVTGDLPVMIWFHGGGLFSGARNDMLLPAWLRDATIKRGWLFISADYRLLVPLTGHVILEDLKALSTYLTSESLKAALPGGITLSPTTVFTSGDSAGGYIARLFSLTHTPKPRALVSMFGMGGDLLLQHYVTTNPNGCAFFHGALPAAAVDRALALTTTLAPSAGSALKFGPPEGPLVYCDDGREPLYPYAIQMGSLVDHMTGAPGLSKELARLPTTAAREAALPPAHRALFPQLRAAELPPTILVHGDADTAVPIAESQATHEALKAAGVKTELVVVEGGEHGLRLASDMAVEAPSAEKAYAQVMTFLEGYL